ncbi:uncharacterized protein F4822DRAFT_407581 [Hypoxylon trugodes]|uniref:uncharacterized protein n=1 Tax=Hypoxylon trugodes TaxID=326681 RepID=UPI0021910E8A|nr:uncharacterized protein F4822DRAFT_407581 [Hypoxylon trugodes]KAI1387788.1 hypothetical protein F4822DRAFT_407581 [Hypoxylon trugodes]
MASSNGSVFSETLQEITNTKLEELSKRRSDFETTKSNILSMLEAEKEPTQRLYILSQGVKACYALKLGKFKKVPNVIARWQQSSELEVELKNLDRFLAQAKYDPSLSLSMLKKWEESLLRHLDTQSLKYEYASLYAQLVTEWLSTTGAKEDEVDVAMTEGFEDVAKAMKLDSRQQWERTVFEPAQVDVARLQSYLDQLFGVGSMDSPAKLKALNHFRQKVATFENEMAAPNQFNPRTLRWVADGLLSSGLLSDEKREVLRDFKNNTIILSEISDVLNMRITSLSSWSWGSAVPLEQRRQISGTYNVLMHEDLLQALFLQYIGIKWSVFLKEAFLKFRGTTGAWESGWKKMPNIDAERRKYYLAGAERDRKNSVQFVRDRTYRKHYFMAHLMDHESQRNEIAEGEEEAQYHAIPPPPPPALAVPATAQQMQQQSLMQQQAVMQQRQAQASASRMRQAPAPSARRAPIAGGPTAGAALFGSVSNNPNLFPNRSVYDPLDDDDGDIENDEDSDNKRPIQSKQRLLRLLSTEIAVNTKLYGEMTAFHSMFERWNTLLPHETILTVLSFFGVSKAWLSFFKKFLTAPLKFLDDDPSVPARNRSRGTPASHVLSDVFGESILFCLDFSVNQSTAGAALFRMQDDFWFWSRDHSAAVTAWKSVTEFVNATGTYIDSTKTGTLRISRDPDVSLEIDRSLPQGEIRWGFLRLNPQTGKFEIDQTMVNKHIIDLRKQLQDKQNSVISFIQAWNTYAATFFTSNFGKAANCFGQDHVAQMLATHERIQREVFSSSSSLASSSGNQKGATNIVDFLKNVMEERFGVSNIPDAYLFFPMELGGLDLKSPFVSILQVHDTVLKDPSKELDKFFEAEKDTYNVRKHAFERNSLGRANQPGFQWKPENPADQENFMSFAEYVRYREDIGYNFDNDLFSVYKKLLELPVEDGIQTADARVTSGINALAQQDNLRSITANWNSMEPYWKWIAQLYGPEAMDRFDGLNIVEPGLLPMGMVSIFREKRVQWQA